MIKLAILGSTGSIGTQTLNIVDQYPDQFCVAALSAHSNTDLLIQQIKKYKPRYVGIANMEAADKIKAELPEGTSMLTGESAAAELASLPEVDTVLVALVGIAGLPAVINAIKGGKKVALATKEAMVCGGEIISDLMKQRGDFIYPVDSEHSAIFQCLRGERHEAVKRLILTASGGPFLNFEKEQLKSVTPKEALKHPNWNMGRKISIDSATLMNKGLEVIEARWLFDIPLEQIDVVIHKESIVHSMVEFEDSSIIAQMSVPDMSLPILYALQYPYRVKSQIKRLDFTKALNLSFAPPDLEKFPCLTLAYDALKEGHTVPTVLNAANEVAVEEFLNFRLSFCDIPKVIEYTMNKMEVIKNPTLDDIYEIDKRAREYLKGQGLKELGL